MTQLNLLESAKQGDLIAIEALMNLPLQPRGVTAKTALNNGCLYVVLSSTRLLNRTTLVNFVRQGLSNLEVASIDVVKVYAHKVGEPSPVWMSEFVLRQVPDDPASNGSGVRATENGIRAFTNPAIALLGSRQDWRDRWQVFNSQVSQYGGQALVQSRQAFLGLQEVSINLVDTIVYSNYLTTSTLVALVAFVSGAVVAVSNSDVGRSSKQPTSSHAPSISVAEKTGATSSETGKTLIQQQAEAKHYLTVMNRAQQTFYLSNHRFASNLEELERSASIISQSAHYTYKLTILDQTRSQLTATPNEQGLKSYIGTVLVSQSKDGSNNAIAAICETRQPSITPPSLPQATGESVTCTADGAKLP
jgi:hypothetical protein